MPVFLMIMQESSVHPGMGDEWMMCKMMHLLYEDSDSTTAELQRTIIELLF